MWKVFAGQDQLLQRLVQQLRVAPAPHPARHPASSNSSQPPCNFVQAAAQHNCPPPATDPAAPTAFDLQLALGSTDDVNIVTVQPIDWEASQRFGIDGLTSLHAVDVASQIDNFFLQIHSALLSG